MTQTLVLTVGVPASGKSTFARQWVAEDPQNRVRVNRDDTRTFLGLQHGENEARVTRFQQQHVKLNLADGKDVVVDDTNLVPKFAKEWLKIAAEFGAEVVWHDEFLKVDPRVCIDRDRDRDAKVGPEVIMRMAERAKHWKRPTLTEESTVTTKPYTGTPGKPKAMLVDIDGTIASNGPTDRSEPHRGWYDWNKVGGDSPIQAIIDIVLAMERQGIKPVFVSGRDAVCRPETTEWIAQHVYGYHNYVGTIAPKIVLHMRPEGDNRKDSIVKLEIFDNEIRDNYDVKFCLDDRNQVVEAYRGIGLTVLQVAPGSF